VWAWLLGRGIIHEPDDIRADNRPQTRTVGSPGEGTRRRRLRPEHLFRLILNSQTYQLSCVPADAGPASAAHFGSYPLRRLEAEVLIDALNQITGSTEKYSSAIPEPFTFIPDDIALDRIAGRQHQQSVSRDVRTLAARYRSGIRTQPPHHRPQRLHLLNSSHSSEARTEPDGPLSDSGQQTSAQGRHRLYLGILSRFPTEAELGKVDAYAKQRRTDATSSSTSHGR